MLHFSDLQRQPVPAQLIAFASAYLDSAVTVCEQLCARAHEANYAHGAVVMSLSFHSLELLFKGGILTVCADAQFGGRSGHDLDALSKRFFKLYPKKDFQFDVPFRREFPEVIGEMPAEEIAALRAYAEDCSRRVPEDQRHRYPIDIEGNTWDGAFGFEPNMFLSTLKELQGVFARVIPLLRAG
ncbi:MAG: hypothetical protein IPI02_20915 [Sterolibacteriaceae bacterium]|nr:hypothetical protein [Sterolibacteriaceae bacterium]